MSRADFKTDYLLVTNPLYNLELIFKQAYSALLLALIFKIWCNKLISIYYIEHRHTKLGLRTEKVGLVYFLL